MQRVELKVGDRSFFTTVGTLETSHFFKNLLTHTDKTNVIYLDRDSTQFRHILNYLRGSPFLPSTNDDLEELAIEELALIITAVFLAVVLFSWE